MATNDKQSQRRQPWFPAIAARAGLETSYFDQWYAQSMQPREEAKLHE